MTDVATMASPYPGPRPFEPGERASFFGRDTELADLRSLVIAHRVVLIYAQSGAGKTSLLNAGLIPSLEEQGFVVLPVARVRGLVPDSIAALTKNIFVANTLMCWCDHEEASNPPALLSQTMASFLKTRGPHLDEQGFNAPQVIVFDQFEELFAFYPERWSEREGFFRQVAEALRADPLLHAVFVMREDYAPGLEPYAPLLPGRFETRYRLERLRPHAACEAAEGPLQDTPRKFAPAVATQLIDQLLAIRVENANGDTVEVKGEFVEPVQLQIAVESLWNELPADVKTISSEHLRAFSDVDQALGDFYETTIEKTTRATGISESELREWFDRRLITPSGTRGTVFRGPDTTEGIANDAVDLLENGHLIRAEMRAGGRWYELTHDRFIRSIQASNDAWRRRTHEANIRGQMRALFGKASLVALIVLTIAAISVFSYSQWRASQRAQAREAAANALLPWIDPEESLCLAINAAALGGGSEAPLVESALRQALRESRVRRVFNGDDEPILTTAFSADGRWLVVTASEGNAANILDRDRQQIQAVKGHTADVTNAVFSADGELIATTTVDGRVYVSRTSNGERLLELNEYGQFLSRVTFSPDTRSLLAASSDGSVRLWDIASKQRVLLLRAHREPVTAAAFSADGARIITASTDRSARIWDLSSGTRLLELAGHRQPLTDAVFAPDGRTVVTASEDMTARVWDAANGSMLAELRGHAGHVLSASFTPNGNTIVTASEDGTARTWIAATGAPIATLRGHQGALKNAAFSRDGHKIVTASVDGTARMWDVSEGWIAALPRQDGVSRLSFSADSRYVVTAASNGGLHVADARTGHPVSESVARKLESGTVIKTMFSPDEQWLQTLGGDGETPSVLSSSADGRTILTVTATDAAVWDVGTRKRRAFLNGHTGWVTAAAFGADGARVATASTDSTVRVWPIDAPESAIVLPQPDGVTTVAFPQGTATADARTANANLVLTTSPNGTARVWDVTAGRVVMELHGPGEVMAAISSDASLVATARADGSIDTYQCDTCGSLQQLRDLARRRMVTRGCEIK